jgi:TrmH family RNA methyltransferase
VSAPLARDHQKIRRLRRLVQRRSARDAERVFVLEGAKVIGEAFAAGVGIEALYVDAGVQDPLIERALAEGVRVHDLAPGVLSLVSDTVTPQPLLAIASYVDVALDALSDATFVVVCVDVRDPGNAGTVLRSAKAAGAGGVVCCSGTVDVYNPKTVRASAGALFGVPVVVGVDPREVLERMASWGLRRLGAAADGGTDYASAELVSPTALVFGNEAHGLPAGLERDLDGFITIPMERATESLNVGMAAAVLCFEVARQRRADAR